MRNKNRNISFSAGNFNWFFNGFNRRQIIRSPFIKSMLFLSLLLIFFSGCAFTDATVKMTYEPTGSEETNGKRELIVEPIIDLRSEKKIIGPVRNGFGDKTANVLLENEQDVSEWITNAIISELGRAGFTVSKAEISSWDGLSVSGDLTSITFDTSPDFFHHSHVIMNIEAQNGDNVILKKTYDGEGKAKAMWGTSSEREAALKAALQDAVNQFVHDLIEQHDKYSFNGESMIEVSLNSQSSNTLRLALHS